MAITQAEIEIGKRLFLEGWGGKTPDAFVPFVTEDFVMRDIVGHPVPMRGHQQVKDFWGFIAGNLHVMPEDVFISDDSGMAMTWMAYIRILDDAQGPENKGRWLCGEGMSRLEFKNGKVCLEVDYWHGPQGMCDDWEAHLKARSVMSRAERGAITGA